MTYTTYFLKFASKEEAETKLTEVGYSSTDPQTQITYYHTNGVPGDVDIIGTIYNSDGVFTIDEDGMPTVTTPPTEKEGYHVNVVLSEELPALLSEYSVVPANPYRVFA